MDKSTLENYPLTGISVYPKTQEYFRPVLSRHPLTISRPLYDERDSRKNRRESLLVFDILTLKRYFTRSYLGLSL